MLINNIIINNFRLYKGENQINFSIDDDRNIFLVAGENGFGKTTFLTSLIWCLYGKQMIEVDNSFKKDFANNGGYATYLTTNLNKSQKEIFDSLEIKNETIKKIKKNGYTFENEYLQQYTQFSISIDFSELLIPSVPCISVKITRKFDIIIEEETVEILIDGKINELSREIGPDVFINDFILNKDIARFFFFDSEKIVSLAEINSTNEKRKLSSAYNEVLGLKKFEDLKQNLENLRIRLRKKTTDIESRNKLTALLNRQSILQLRLTEYEKHIIDIDEEISILKKKNDDFQMTLLREGNSMTVESFKQQQAVYDIAQKKDIEYKLKLKELLDLVPLAISGRAFLLAKEQSEKDELKLRLSKDTKSQNELLENVLVALKEQISKSNATQNNKSIWSITVDSTIAQFYKEDPNEFDTPILIEMPKEQHAELQAIYSNLTTTFKLEFQRLTEDYKKNRQILERTSRIISKTHTNESDSVIKEIRKEKDEVESQIVQKEQEVRAIFEKNGSDSKELNSLARKISELSKLVSLDDSDTKKDEIAERLIKELDTFLHNLKIEKKASLEKRIQQTMNSLMHKDDFIKAVRVDIFNDIIDINLLDKSNCIINKESLSKGEQQLYATSILKSLVDESGTQFPVFIDSPLQKFDKRHSRKIISEFYPRISKQVILFPLLYKELTEEEYDFMRPKVKRVFEIQNEMGKSSFKEIDPNNLF